MIFQEERISMFLAINFKKQLILRTIDPGTS